MAIVRAILAGERDPHRLAELRHPQIRADHEEIAKSLEGNWRPELLFVLQQEVDMYDTYRRRIAECDRGLEAHLKSMPGMIPQNATGQDPTSQPDRPSERKLAPSGKRVQGNAPRFDLGGELQRIAGVDLTRIDSVSVMVAQTVISEVDWI